MILPDTKHKSDDNPSLSAAAVSVISSEVAGSTTFTSLSTTSSASVMSTSEEMDPPPYTPERDPQVDLLEGEDPTTQRRALPTLPSRTSTTTTEPAPLPLPLISQIPPNLPRQNRLRVFRESSGISDTYVIDPTLPAPPGSHDKALSLYSQNGSIEATVFLTQGQGKQPKGKVELEALSMNGSIRFCVAECPPNMRLSIHVESRNGSCALFLPPSFRGPLTLSHEYGGSFLTPSLKSHTRTLDETHTLHRCWVGEWDEEGDAGWVADECEVASFNGSVKVGYWSPEEAVRTQIPKGRFEKVFGKK